MGACVVARPRGRRARGWRMTMGSAFSVRSAIPVCSGMALGRGVSVRSGVLADLAWRRGGRSRRVVARERDPLATEAEDRQGN
jgi:hypothetical protein